MSNLLDRVVARDTVAGDGKSGSVVERLTLDDGSVVVVKRIAPLGDWIMRATHDHGRAASLWTSGVLADVPAAIDHTVLGVEPDGDGWLIVMRDAGPQFLSLEADLTFDQTRRILDAAAALHATFRGRSIPDLCPMEDRYLGFGPATWEREVDEVVPQLIRRGWEVLQDTVPGDVASVLVALAADPAPLVDRLRTRPETLIHGDLKIGNLGFAEDRLVLVDWGTQTGMAPTAVEWAWFLAICGARLTMSREEVLAYTRTLEGDLYDPEAERLALLGAAVQLGWNKALDAATNPDPAVRGREQADLDWWVAAARRALDQW